MRSLQHILELNLDPLLADHCRGDGDSCVAGEFEHRVVGDGV